MDSAVDVKDLSQHFLDKLKYSEKEEKFIVSSSQYVDRLAPILAWYNPYCRFKVTLTPCYQSHDWRYNETENRVWNAQLGCEVEGCAIVVSIRISYPSGHVSLRFSDKHQRPDTVDIDDGYEEAAGADDIITLNHTGKLGEIHDVDIQKKITQCKSISAVTRISEKDYEDGSALGGDSHNSYISSLDTS